MKLTRKCAQVAHLQSLVMRLQWDSTLHKQLESVRLVFMPIVNPGGMALGMPANPHSVDLMRNAPVDAREPVPFLVGGQRISARLPPHWLWPGIGSAPCVSTPAPVTICRWTTGLGLPRKCGNG